MTQPDDSGRLERLQQIRSGMEALHTDALAERDGKLSTTKETVALVRRPAQR